MHTVLLARAQGGPWLPGGRRRLSALRVMKLDRARAEGERVVIELLRKFRQDTGNAKWIGRMAIGPLEQRLASFKTSGNSESGDLESDASESVTRPLDETHPTSQNSSSA